MIKQNLKKIKDNWFRFELLPFDLFLIIHFLHLHVRWWPKKWVSTCIFFYFKKTFSELDCNICCKVIAYKICRLQMMGKTHLFTYCHVDFQFLWICLLSDTLVKEQALFSFHNKNVHISNKTHSLLNGQMVKYCKSLNCFHDMVNRTPTLHMKISHFNFFMRLKKPHTVSFNICPEI